MSLLNKPPKNDNRKASSTDGKGHQNTQEQIHTSKNGPKTEPTNHQINTLAASPNKKGSPKPNLIVQPNVGSSNSIQSSKRKVHRRPRSGPEVSHEAGLSIKEKKKHHPLRPNIVIPIHKFLRRLAGKKYNKTMTPAPVTLEASEVGPHGPSNLHRDSIADKSTVGSHANALHLRNEMGRYSQEINMFNQQFKPFKTTSKSQSLEQQHGVSSGNVGHLEISDRRQSQSVKRLDSSSQTSGATDGDSSKNTSHALSKKPKIVFHPEDEWKMFIPHPRSYKLSIPKSSLGLDIFTHADKLWIDQKGSAEEGWASKFEYDVFDDSEQRIISVSREFPLSFEDLNKSQISTLLHQRPIEFICHTAVGKELCIMTYDTTFNENTMNLWRKPYPFLKLEIWIKATKIATVEQKQKKIFVKDPHQFEIIECVDVPAAVRWGCCRKDHKFQFQVFLKGKIKRLCGIIGRNGQRNIVEGKPLGFYFYPVDSSPHTPLRPLYKLYILAILVGLTTVYTELDYNATT